MSRRIWHLDSQHEEGAAHHDVPGRRETNIDQFFRHKLSYAADAWGLAVPGERRPACQFDSAGLQLLAWKTC